MTSTYDSTPAADGFHMPAEWAEHDGCWMIWPERPDNWRLGAKPAQAAFAAVATAIAGGGEQLTMAVSERQFDHARGVLPPEVRVVEMTSDDSWMRDVGPSFVVDGDGERRGVDWLFNAWGGKEGGLYGAWLHDDRVARKVLEVERAGRYRAPLVLEGGSIHVDGEGTVLTTEECLLNHNRNPSLTREQIEEQLRAYLGVEKVLWLGAGTVNDETDGHIDNIACFTAPGVVALHWTDDESDPQHAISKDALQRLEGMTDARGRSLEVHKLPMPGPLLMSEEQAGGVDPGRGLGAARGGRAPRRLVRELLHRQHAHRDAAARRAHRRSGARDPRRPVPGPRGRRRPGARDPARRGQRPLHHAAAAARRTAQFDDSTSLSSCLRGALTCTECSPSLIVAAFAASASCRLAAVLIADRSAAPCLTPAISLSRALLIAASSGGSRDCERGRRGAGALGEPAELGLQDRVGPRLRRSSPPSRCPLRCRGSPR